MDSERFRRISEVFHDVVEIPPGPGRDERLSQLGADDPALISEVRSLLAADAGLDAFASPEQLIGKGLNKDRENRPI